MAEKMISRIAGFLTLLVFVFVSCSPPISDEPAPAKPALTVPVGQGDLRGMYLTRDRTPTEVDTDGVTMFYVEGNELAAGVAVISEVPWNNPRTGGIVQVVNTNNKSSVTFYFNSGEWFPYKMVVKMDNRELTGTFSPYNEATETYSVAFNPPDATLPDSLILNKQVKTLYQDDETITETQNIRVKNMITSLALWNSLAFQLNPDFTVNARWNWFNTLLTAVVTALAVIAFVATVILAPPVAVSILGISVTLGVPGTAAVIGASAVGLGIIAQLPALAPPPLDNYPQQPAPPPPVEVVPSPASVIVTSGGSTVTNNGAVYRLPNTDDSITFDFVFSDLDPSELAIRIQGFDNTRPLDSPISNVFFFNSPTHSIDSNGLHVTIIRGDIGSVRTGGCQFVVFFGKELRINGSDVGVPFKESISAETVTRKDIFIFNFNSRP